VVGRPNRHRDKHQEDVVTKPCLFELLRREGEGKREERKRERMSVKREIGVCV
jgi:hypothetical protein